MRKPLFYLALSSFVFISCTKSGVISEVEIPQENLSPPPPDGTSSTGRTYNGMVDLAQLPDGDYTNGQIIFDQIIHSTGSFADGEAVEDISFHFDPAQTPNVLWSTSRGPYFAYTQGTAIGGSYSPSFMSSYLSFDSAYTKFVDSGFYRKSGQKIFSMPILSDYLPTTGGVGELVVTGVVVRRHASATTLAVAPGTFSPVAPPGVGTPTLYVLGEMYVPPYIIHINVTSSGIPINGDVTSVEVYDASYAPVAIQGFVASYTKRASPLSGWDIVGEITLLDNSIISITGVVDGF